MTIDPYRVEPSLSLVARSVQRAIAVHPLVPCFSFHSLFELNPVRTSPAIRALSPDVRTYLLASPILNLLLTDGKQKLRSFPNRFTPPPVPYASVTHSAQAARSLLSNKMAALMESSGDARAGEDSLHRSLRRKGSRSGVQGCHSPVREFAGLNAI